MLNGQKSERDHEIKYYNIAEIVGWHCNSWTDAQQDSVPRSIAGRLTTVGQEFYLFTMFGHPFSDSPTLTNSVWSYWCLHDFLMMVAGDQLLPFCCNYYATNSITDQRNIRIILHGQLMAARWVFKHLYYFWPQTAAVLLLAASYHFVTPCHVGSPWSIPARLLATEHCCHSCSDGQPLPDRYALICGSMSVTALPFTVTLVPPAHSHCPLQSQLLDKDFCHAASNSQPLVSHCNSVGALWYLTFLNNFPNATVLYLPLSDNISELDYNIYIYINAL
jgi:hypothetical protein